MEYYFPLLHFSVKNDDIDPETTLNDYLRLKLHLKGTKRMCYEGGCGACVVAVTKPGDNKVMAVNSVSIERKSWTNIYNLKAIRFGNKSLSTFFQ